MTIAPYLLAAALIAPSVQAEEEVTFSDLWLLQLQDQAWQRRQNSKRELFEWLDNLSGFDGPSFLDRPYHYGSREIVLPAPRYIDRRPRPFHSLIEDCWYVWDGERYVKVCE